MSVEVRDGGTVTTYQDPYCVLVGGTSYWAVSHEFIGAWLLLTEVYSEHKVNKVRLTAFSTESSPIMIWPGDREKDR